jgi:hypothetical protein
MEGEWQSLPLTEHKGKRTGLGPVLFFAWHEQGEKYFWLQIWLQSCKFWLEFYVHGRITVCLRGTGENTENKRKFP